MKRDLPVFSIEGTDFLVDVYRLELRQKDNPANRILFENMRDVDDGYTINYSTTAKNLPPLSEQNWITVKLPDWVVLDPLGMAKKYGLTQEELKGKTDFDLMVDQQAFDKRVNQGMLPTVEIAGHIFYVDVRMDMLRPKDDFTSNGIAFSEIDTYHLEVSDEYLIPYNPKTHEFQDLNFETITEYPNDLLAIKFPCEWILDPIGWNRREGLNLHHDIKHKGIRSHFHAEVIPWEKTFLRDIIIENRQKHIRETYNNGIRPGPGIEQNGKKGRKR